MKKWEKNRKKWIQKLLDEFNQVKIRKVLKEIQDLKHELRAQLQKNPINKNKKFFKIFFETLYEFHFFFNTIKRRKRKK